MPIPSARRRARRPPTGLTTPRRIHYLDTMGGGHFENIPELVEVLVKDAPSAIKWLEKLGVNWDKTPDGSMHELSGGGTSRRRLHSARDYTGLEEMRVLRDEMRNKKIRLP